MTAQTIAFDGRFLQRGFWLYVWEVSVPGGRKLCYVGRTGDSSSANAQSPFNRMGQHLSFNEKHNVLRKRLVGIGVEPESCTFRLVSVGPLYPEASSMEGHRPLRDTVAAFEQALACSLSESGYEVINPVHCRKPLNEMAFAMVLAEFAKQLPLLILPTAAGAI